LREALGLVILPLAMPRRTVKRAQPAQLLPLLGLLALVAPWASGCGHPASEAECEAIVNRIVELELKAQKVTDPAEIAKRRSESLGLAGDKGKAEVLQGCIGKRITDRALVCVREADNASEITDRCLQ
jgi:hypothetical protein